MAKYQATYKCPLCRTTLRYGEPQEVPYDTLPQLLGKFQSLQRFASNPYLASDIPPAYVPCKCPDGSCGLAPFAGFRKVGE